MNRKNKRGFTLAEMMVAIVIISIVSVTAMTIVLSSSQAGAKSERWFAANTAAVNMNECYRSAGGNASGFQTLLTEECGFTTVDLTGLTAEQITEKYGEYDQSDDFLYGYGEFVLKMRGNTITVYYENDGEISVIYELER